MDVRINSDSPRADMDRLESNLESDLNLLVREVRARPALWDSTCIYHSNIDIVQHLWSEVASLCRLPVEAVKLKWKCLREKASEERSELESNVPGCVDSDGLPYRRLLFLEPQVQSQCDSMTPRQPSYDTVPLLVKPECDVRAAENWNPSLLNNIRKFLRPLQTTIVTRSKEKEIEDGGGGKRMVSGKRWRDRDDTHMYLASLIAPLSQLPPPRQRRVLAKIRDIILNESKRVYVNSLRNT